MDKYPGLYVHIPFCKKKCLYCDFTSFSGSELYIDKYLSALENEARQYQGTKCETLFIGGGTPTVLTEKQLDRLMNIINSVFDMSVCREASIEANPGTVTDEKLRVLSRGGINRISIGVQSFCDAELKTLGRIHTSKQAISAIELSKKYFDNINIDIMTSLPLQNKERLMSTLETAVKCDVPHLSCYSLIIEDGTEFKRLFENGKLNVPSEDSDREMFEMLCNYLRESGYERYEISNFAKPGFRCRHNMKYWTANEYIGIGLSAHSYLCGKRFSNNSSFSGYLSLESCRTDEIILGDDDKKEEFTMLMLRTSDGIDEKEYESRFSESFYLKNKEKIDKFISLGLVRKTNIGYAFTDRGFDISNTLICELI
mgnify:FL=1